MMKRDSLRPHLFLSFIFLTCVVKLVATLPAAATLPASATLPAAATSTSSLVVVDGQRRLQPLLFAGDLVTPPPPPPGRRHSSKHRQYRLTEFVRVQGDKPYLERVRVDPVYFTPTLEAGGAYDASLRLVSSASASPPALDMGSELLNTRAVAAPGSAAAPSSLQEAVLNSDDGSNWRLRHRTNRGSHGEVWRGTRVEDEAFDEDEEDDEEGGQPRQRRRRRRRRRRRPTGYVLKRMLLEKGEEVALAAAREIFFGEQFRNATSAAAATSRGKSLSRFVESFTTASGELSSKRCRLTFQW